MRQRLRAVRSDESGFTLTELLIVIVILGVLTGIVVFAVGAFQDRGQVAACRADQKVLQVAVEAYRAQLNTYPPTGNEVALVTGGYLQSISANVDFVTNAGPPQSVTVSAQVGSPCVGLL